MGAVPTDFPAKTIDTKIFTKSRSALPFSWLDNDILVVTTLSDSLKQGYFESNFDTKVITLNLLSMQQTTIAEHGLLSCANPDENVFNILQGTLEKTFSSTSNTPNPVPVFIRWDKITKQIVQASPQPKDQWNPYLCLKTSKEYAAATPMEFLQQRIRFLLANDGYITWESGSYDKNKPGPQLLLVSGEGKPPKPLNATTDDISFPVYLPFSKSYLLKTGRFVTGNSRFTVRGEAVMEMPTVVMDRNGKISKTLVADTMSKSSSGAEGIAFPSAAGTIVYADNGGRPDSGSGIYLLNGDAYKRIWCTAPDKTTVANLKEEFCGLASKIELSPNGCKLAFYASENSYFSRSSLKIIDICN